jgi:hypothetical protein
MMLVCASSWFEQRVKEAKDLCGEGQIGLWLRHEEVRCGVEMTQPQLSAAAVLCKPQTPVEPAGIKQLAGTMCVTASSLQGIRSHQPTVLLAAQLKSSAHANTTDTQLCKQKQRVISKPRPALACTVFTRFGRHQ